nr:PREDICTED: replication protein A 70 kDa DNA-binding subunit D-like [Daucus carota subsp. sativus]
MMIDVVGEITNKHVSCVYSKEDKCNTHIRFQITDGRYIVNVTFFNELAEQFEKALKQLEDSYIYVIISSAKVNEHEGLPCLNNYPATRFYLNVDHYSVKQLKSRMSEIPKTEAVEEVPVEQIKPMLSVADIKKLTSDYAKRKVCCQITVKKVDVKTNWYDNVCTTCAAEVQIVQGRFKCENCVRNIPFPDKRFRLATICNDETGILAIIFPDDEIQRILGRNAFDIEEDENEVSDEVTFPPSLKAFEKKQFVVTLLLTEQNVNKTCNIYTATELNDPAEMLGNHSPSRIQSIASEPIRETMELERSKDTFSSPPTGKSTNKVKTRSTDENVSVAIMETMEIERNTETLISPPTGKSTTKVRTRSTDEDATNSMEENVPLAKFKIVKTEKK